MEFGFGSRCKSVLISNKASSIKYPGLVEEVNGIIHCIDADALIKCTEVDIKIDS